MVTMVLQNRVVLTRSDPPFERFHRVRVWDCSVLSVFKSNGDCVWSAEFDQYQLNLNISRLGNSNNDGNSVTTSINFTGKSEWN